MKRKKLNKPAILLLTVPAPNFKRLLVFYLTENILITKTA